MSFPPGALKCQGHRYHFIFKKIFNFVNNWNSYLLILRAKFREICLKFKKERWQTNEIRISIKLQEEVLLKVHGLWSLLVNISIVRYAQESGSRMIFEGRHCNNPKCFQELYEVQGTHSNIEKIIWKKKNTIETIWSAFTAYSSYLEKLEAVLSCKWFLVPGRLQFGHVDLCCVWQQSINAGNRRHESVDLIHSKR